MMDVPVIPSYMEGPHGIRLLPILTSRCGPVLSVPCLCWPSEA
jgi:hypothetical protein